MVQLGFSFIAHEGAALAGHGPCVALTTIKHYYAAVLIDLSVCPSFPHKLLTREQKGLEKKIVCSSSNRRANFHFEKSKIELTKVKNLQNMTQTSRKHGLCGGNVK